MPSRLEKTVTPRVRDRCVELILKRREYEKRCGGQVWICCSSRSADQDAHARCTACATYRRRQPERTVLYRIVQTHLATRLELAQDESVRDTRPRRAGIPPSPRRRRGFF